MGSIFVTDPATALQLAKRHLRVYTTEDLTRYCEEHGFDAAAFIAAVCGVEAAMSAEQLEALTDEQVAAVWRHVDRAEAERGKMEHSA